MPKPNLHRYNLFCYDCKRHYEYWEVNKADALKKFDAVGHDNRRKRVLRKDYGRGQVVVYRRRGRRAA